MQMNFYLGFVSNVKLNVLNVDASTTAAPSI